MKEQDILSNVSPSVIKKIREEAGHSGFRRVIDTSNPQLIMMAALTTKKPEVLCNIFLKEDIGK